MATKLVSSSFSCVIPPSFSSPFQSRKSSQSQRELSRTKRNLQQLSSMQLGNDQGLLKFHYSPRGAQISKSWFPKKRRTLFALSEDRLQSIEPAPDTAEEGSNQSNLQDASEVSSSSIYFEGTDGKPGFISFYRRPNKSRPQDNIFSEVPRNTGSPLWFVGPAVLVASFVFPSLYMRRILSAVFEDSLLTDFLILFFTEALFYCGMAAFLLLIDRLRRPLVQNSAPKVNNSEPSFGQRISAGVMLVLSLTIPMVTMGLVWPWTGPAASATLAPYLVGITVQFAFEQFARYRKSPALPIIPIIFQIYRLHQLNRATQLVTALSFTVKGAEATAHNIAINRSLGTLLIVLQVLGIICIWSLSSILMKFSPSAPEITP